MNNTLTRKLIITNIFALFSGTAISQVALALVLFLTARALGTNAYGQYVACFALTKITAIIFNLGMDTWLLREGRRSHTPLGNLVGSNISIKLFMGGIWFLGIIFVSRYLNHSTYPPGLLYIAAIATWLEATINTAIFAFNANLRNKITASITISSSVTLLIITLLLTYNQLTDVMVFAYARLVIAFITAGVAFWWLSKEIKLGTNQITIRRIVNGTFPFMLSDALLLIYTQADLIIIAYYLGTVATGLYSTASGMIRALFIVPQAVHVVMVPIFGQLLIENYLLFKKTFQKMSLTIVFIGAGLWIALAILGPLLILFILGEDFIASIEVLLILTPILYIKSISHAMAAFIVAVGYQKFRVAIQGVVAGLNVGLNILIINSFGINGVAWVYVISELILLVGYMILVWRWQVIARDKVLTPQKVNGH